MSEVMFYTEAGRARKKCKNPECDKFIHVRKTACPACGFANPIGSGQSEPAVEAGADDKPAGTPDAGTASLRPPVAYNAGIDEIVRIPSGPCPVAFPSIRDRNSVQGWVSDVQAAFERRGQFLQQEGMEYFAGQFVDGNILDNVNDYIAEVFANGVPSAT